MHIHGLFYADGGMGEDCAYIAGLVPFVVGVTYAIKIEQIAGYYECQHCKHKYVPTYAQVFFAMHSGRTRYMKCPACGQKSWQRKVISK